MKQIITTQIKFFLFINSIEDCFGSVAYKNVGSILFGPLNFVSLHASKSNVIMMLV